MGGSGFIIAETENYRWEMYTTYSGAFPLHKLRLYRKSDDGEIETRDYSEDSNYQEYDDAVGEFEEQGNLLEWDRRLNSEQITCAMMWKRMTRAEANSRYANDRANRAEGVVKELHQAQRKLGEVEAEIRSQKNGKE